MNFDFGDGVALGLFLMFVVMIYRETLYRRILRRIGDSGGSEKIDGVWYRIIREDCVDTRDSADQVGQEFSGEEA